MDAVVIGAILAVTGSLIVIGWLGFKIRDLMERDARDGRAD